MIEVIKMLFFSIAQAIWDMVWKVLLTRGKTVATF